MVIKKLSAVQIIVQTAINNDAFGILKLDVDKLKTPKPPFGWRIASIDLLCKPTGQLARIRQTIMRVQNDAANVSGINSWISSQVEVYFPLKHMEKEKKTHFIVDMMAACVEHTSETSFGKKEGAAFCEKFMGSFYEIDSGWRTTRGERVFINSVEEMDEFSPSVSCCCGSRPFCSVVVMARWTR